MAKGSPSAMINVNAVASDGPYGASAVEAACSAAADRERPVAQREAAAAAAEEGADDGLLAELDHGIRAARSSSRRAVPRGGSI
ncbi:MAG: hypothetical protein LC732_07080 [Acidobacteria bacterium]|nr:hypothetical protein [Acidobacteriota bacterium]